MSDHIHISLHVPERRKRSTGESRIGLFEFECLGCGHRFEEIVAYNETQDQLCDVCGDETRLVISFSTNKEEQNRYPYFDRGLGCWLESKADRDRICKERGLVPVEGDTNFGDPYGFKQDAREAEEEIAEYDAYMDKVENDPALAAYREARDKGQFDSTPKVTS